MMFLLNSSSSRAAALVFRCGSRVGRRWDELQVQVLAPVPPRETNMLRCQGYEIAQQLPVGGGGGR